jgi:hypothetical protein
VDLVVVVEGEADLLQVVDAPGPPRRLARRLDGGQQQGDQDGDDRDDHQQLDQREAPVVASRSHRLIPRPRMVARTRMTAGAGRVK